jgi:hypothetical protein
MKSPKKFKFELEGMMFELPIKFLKKTDYYGKPLSKPEIRIDHVAGASVVKQYVKTKYPEVVVSAKSNSFSMGNSVDVYISDKFGNGVDESISKDVNRFGSQFEYGKFNGMIDMYEMNEGSDPTTDNGTVIDAGVKYFHCNNRPKFASLPDAVRMLREMTTTNNYTFGQLSLEKAIKQVKGYGVTDVNINKALQLI